MNKVTAVFFVSIINKVVLMNQSERIPELEDNYFYKINNQLQDTVNKVFILMKLDKQFATTYKNRMLLTMHASMKGIAESNYDILKKVNGSSRVDATIKAKDHLFNLDEPLNGVLKNNTPPDIKQLIIGTITKLLLESRLLEVPAEVEDSFMYLREYLNIVKNINVGDIAASTKNPLNRDLMAHTPEYKKMRHHLGRKRNDHHRFRQRNYHHHLKLWKAPSSELNTRRLYEGKEVKVKKYPFMASVHVQGDFVCTGSIISDDMVITAASCLQVVFNNRSFLQYNPEGVAVRIGSDFADRNGGKIFIDQVFFHPGYDPSSLRNNLAIVRISQRLHLKKNKKIKRIGFQRMEAPIPSTIKDVFVLGWGLAALEGKNNELMLSYTRLDIYDTKECMNIYTKKFVTDKNFCAGFTNKRSGVCQRDIGGPGVVGSTLMGVVSFGPPVCGTPDAPTVFTNIGYFVEWIESVLKGNPLRIGSRSPIDQAPSSDIVLSKTSQTPQSNKIARTVTTTRFAATSLPAKKINRPIHKSQKNKHPKALHLLKVLLNEIMDYEYDDDTFITDGHLWEPTKFDPYKHPLLNQSLFGLEPEAIEDMVTDHPHPHAVTVGSTRGDLYISGMPLSYIARDTHNGQVQMFEEMDSNNATSDSNDKSQSESKSKEGLSIEIPKSYLKVPASSETNEVPEELPASLRSYATEPKIVHRFSRTTPLQITIPFGVKYHKVRGPTYPPTKKRIPNRYADSADKTDDRAAEILRNNFVLDKYPMEATESKMEYLKKVTTRINRYRFVITKNDELGNSDNILKPSSQRYYKRVSKRYKESTPRKRALSTFKNQRFPPNDFDVPFFRSMIHSDVGSAEFAALNESAELDGLSKEIKDFLAS